MSAYGGFTKTSYGAQGGDDSGGFFAGGSQPGSQGGGSGKLTGGVNSQSYQDESLRPVTIKQILDADEPFSGADFKIDGSPVTQITFVGQVRSVNPQPTNITFKIDDGTGQIEVKKWIDADKQDEPDPGFELDSHVRVWGRLKSFSNKRHVGAHVIRPVADFNEVNYHLLEATYVHLFFTRGPPGGQQQQQQQQNGDSMFVDGGAGYGNGATAGAGQANSKLADCSPAAKNVFNYMNSTPGGNEGVHLNVISSSLGMSVRDVLMAAEDLLQRGLIYTTVDDETWAVLDY
ncbi:DNA-directed RNA polymerase I subunit RPA1 [Purpureocillium lavendulum]|uniref:DNA-directed RNA polymerase I subunit RPA1 n=1 Tax=Purpureocillium lavendulum TaxID=1247861 RepID=A0AB34FZK3_9HYPO|nr:DNA-directed RNA polymerase I subunit RPA1 [Purpureocillium lavendulum]